RPRRRARGPGAVGWGDRVVGRPARNGALASTRTGAASARAERWLGAAPATGGGRPAAPCALARATARAGRGRRRGHRRGTASAGAGDPRGDPSLGRGLGRPRG